jgi:hypothetical protein
MSKAETPMILRYWESIGGTLVEEFQMVTGSPSCVHRRADAIILPALVTRRVPVGQRAGISLVDQDVIVIQAKSSRLGMSVMGQAVFSAELVRRFNPASIRSVLLCTQDDSVLRPLLAHYPHVEVVVMSEFSKRQAQLRAEPSMAQTPGRSQADDRN